jgi:hypothetical protein
MEQIEVKHWAELKKFFQGHAALPREMQSRFIFRGQAVSAWKLQTSLDRLRNFQNDDERTRFATLMLQEFRAEALGLSAMSSAGFPNGDALDVLARDHGLPSTLMDWTYSPYIAAYFAYVGAAQENSAKAAIWSLDRTKCRDALSAGAVDIIEDRDLIRFNVRALEQRGLFLRVATIKRPLEDLLEAAIMKFDVDLSDRGVALSDLDNMTITAKNLFRDLDGAAKTATNRVMRGR